MLAGAYRSSVRNAVCSMNVLSRYRCPTITEKGNFNVAIYFSILLLSPFKDRLAAE